MAKQKNNEPEVIKSNKQTEYKKEQFLNSKKFRDKKDLLSVLLEDKQYTVEEVKNIIEKFLKTEVK